jgi:hypothetical protein
MSNYLPTDLIYYVYNHIDPRDGELLYIGHGCRGRAWIHGSKKTCLRSQDHLDHLESMTFDGFTPEDWVTLVVSGTTKKDACVIEQKMIRGWKPKYNKPQGLQHLKVTPDILTMCEDMRANGAFYDVIGKEVGLSTMTVYRALNGQTKNIGEDFYE